MSATIYHIHHIIPKHAGGTDDPSNLIKLTVEEHAEAHRILWEQYGRLEDKAAWLGLSGLAKECYQTLGDIGRIAMQKPEIILKQRASCRRGRRGPQTPKHRANIRKSLAGKRRGVHNHMYGKRHSSCTRQQMSAAQTGNKNHMHGKTHSEETRVKIRESVKRRIWLKRMNRVIAPMAILLVHHP